MNIRDLDYCDFLVVAVEPTPYGGASRRTSVIALTSSRTGASARGSTATADALALGTNTAATVRTNTYSSSMGRSIFSYGTASAEAIATNDTQGAYSQAESLSTYGSAGSQSRSISFNFGAEYIF